MKKTRTKGNKKPARRNIIHQHARLKSGAGVHSNKQADNWKGNISMQLSLAQFKEEHGITSGADMTDALNEWISDSIVPAMCAEGCEVEPDGECVHGCQSILIRMGVI